MQIYKTYPISGSARPQPAKATGGAYGEIFEPGLFRAKAACRVLRQFQSGSDIVFYSKEEAENFGLLMCRAWIDGLPT